MSYVFLGSLATMLVAAVIIVAFPVSPGKRIVGSPQFLIIAFVPLATIVLYGILGRPDAIDGSEASHRAIQSRQQQESKSDGTDGIPTVASLIGGLEDRLEKEPGDAGGWLLLAQSYDHVGRQQDARKAYERAKALGKTHADLESSLYATPEIDTVQETVASAAIRGRVSLSPEVAVQVELSDTIFIFAKASAEQRMPVAALRKSVADLPLEFELSDAQAMVPGTRLSDHDKLVLTARISRSGNAGDILNGLEVTAGPVSPGSSERIELLIARTAASAGAVND